MILAALTTDTATATAILIASVAAAVVSVIGALQNRRAAAQAKLPSNTITPGTAAENTTIAVGQLVHLLGQIVGKDVSIPTPAETQNNMPGATLASPPPPPTDIVPPAPPPPVE